MFHIKEGFLQGKYKFALKPLSAIKTISLIYISFEILQGSSVYMIQLKPLMFSRTQPTESVIVFPPSSPGFWLLNTICAQCSAFWPADKKGRSPGNIGSGTERRKTFQIYRLTSTRALQYKTKELNAHMK